MQKAAVLEREREEDGRSERTRRVGCLLPEEDNFQAGEEAAGSGEEWTAVGLCAGRPSQRVCHGGVRVEMATGA